MSRLQIETAENAFNEYQESNMENINELATALSIAQSKMEGAAKDKDNPFFKSKYADLASVTSAVRTGLNGTGLSYIQITHDCENGVAIETVILHASGQHKSCGIVRVPVAKTDAQGYGSAMTYARRFGLAMAFGVAPEDDDGNAATKAKPEPKKLESGSAPKIEFDKLPESKQSSIRDMVLLLGKFTEAENYAGGFEMLQSFGLDADDKVALWSQLNSATRSAFKRISDAQRVVA
jgi:hypothetical protein